LIPACAAFTPRPLSFFKARSIRWAMPFKIPGSFGYPIAGSCTVVSEERILLSVKPTAVAVRMISALIAALPAPANAASARAMFE